MAGRPGSCCFLSRSGAWPRPQAGGVLSRAASKHLSGCASAVEPFLDGWRTRGRHEPSQTADAPHVQAFSKCADGCGTESE